MGTSEKSMVLRLFQCLRLSVVSIPAAASTLPGRPYSEITKGVVVSTVEDVTSTTGTVSATLIAHGTSSGSQMASEAVSSCSLGLGGRISGSTIAVAKLLHLVYRNGVRVNFDLDICDV